MFRPGMASASQLGKVRGRLPAIGGADAPRVSGSLAAHYAPRTPLALLQPDVVIFAVREAMAANKRIGIIAPMACPLSDERIVWRQISGEAAGFAHDIYALLRELDEMGCARIVVQKPPLVNALAHCSSPVGPQASLSHGPLAAMPTAIATHEPLLQVVPEAQPTGIWV